MADASPGLNPHRAPQMPRQQVREAWPRRAQLQKLPEGTIEAIEVAAANVIHRFLVPCWRLHSKLSTQRKLTQARSAAKEFSTAAALQRLTGVAPFASWRPEILAKLLAAATRRSLERGAVATYRGTPADGVDVLFVLHGATETVDEGSHREVITGPAILNALVAAEGSSATSTSRATSLADCFCIQSAVFRQLLRELSPALVGPLQNSCFNARRALHSSRTFDPKMLLRSQLFSSLSEGEAGEVAQRFVPFSLHNEEVVFRANRRVEHLLVLFSGSVHEAEGSTLWSTGDFIGEIECLFGMKWHTRTVCAGPLTETWRLPVSELHRLCGTDGPYAARVRQILRGNREHAASVSTAVAQQRREYARHMPIFSWCLHASQLDSMADTVFQSRTFLPEETVCARAALCDGVFVILQGSCRIMVHGKPFPMEAGTWGGHTLLCRHSWAFSVMSVGVVDVAWASRAQILSFLRAKAPSKVKEAARWMSIMLRPSQHSPAEAVKLAELMDRYVPREHRVSVQLYTPDAIAEQTAGLALPLRPKYSAEAKALADSISPKRALPVDVLTGKNTAFFRSPLGLTAHTSVFTAKKWIPVPPTGPAPSTPSAAPLHSQLVSGSSFRNRSIDMRKDPADDAVNMHKAKVDRLWLSLPLSLRIQVPRLYPPFRKRHSVAQFSSLISQRTSCGNLSEESDDAMIRWAGVRGQDGALAHQFFEAVAAFRRKVSSES